MKPTTDSGIGHDRKTSTSTSDVQSFTFPRGTSHVEFQVYTTDAWVTYDGTAPSPTNGLLFPAGQTSVFRTLGQGTTLKFVSSAAAASTLSIAYLQ